MNYTAPAAPLIPLDRLHSWIACTARGRFALAMKCRRGGRLLNFSDFRKGHFGKLL
jgi:hypothetical protein